MDKFKEQLILNTHTYMLNNLDMSISEACKYLDISSSQYDYKVHWSQILAKMTMEYVNALLEECSKNN